MTFRSTLTGSIVLFTAAGLAYIGGLRWAGYGLAFLNIPLWLLWARSKMS